MDRGAWWAAVHGVAKSRTRLSNFSFTFHFRALEEEMATHSSVLAWRIPGTAEPCGLPSMGSHRVRHDWSDLAAAAAVAEWACAGGFRSFVCWKPNFLAGKGVGRGHCGLTPGTAPVRGAGEKTFPHFLICSGGTEGLCNPHPAPLMALDSAELSEAVRTPPLRVFPVLPFVSKASTYLQEQGDTWARLLGWKIYNLQADNGAQRKHDYRPGAGSNPTGVNTPMTPRQVHQRSHATLRATCLGHFQSRDWLLGVREQLKKRG